VVAVQTVLAGLVAAPSFAAPAKGASGRYLVLARSAADARAAGVATDRLTSLDVADRARPDLSAPGLLGATRLRAEAPGASPRPGSTPTRPGTTRACSGTTGAWACPRAGGRRPAAPR
jgi:hypothetical protein